MLKNKLSLSIVMACCLMAGSAAFAAPATESKSAPATAIESQPVPVTTATAPLLTEQVIDRVYELKQSLNISGVADHAHHSEHDASLEKEFVTAVYKVLDKLDNVQDKLGFLMGLNARLQQGHIHVNHNFPLKLSAEDQKYIDVVYTSFLFELLERTQGQDNKAIKTQIDKLEREIPFEIYEADFDKVRKKFG